LTGIAIVLAVCVLYGLAARTLDKVSITTPIALVTAGIVLGDGGFKVLHVSAGAESVKVLSEITLAVLLFADASTISLRAAEEDIGLPGRLLGIGLPLTMALGALVAHALFRVNWAQAALLSCILAPTDAALGLAVVTNTAVPARIRRALNIESGLNDGIATPFVVFFLAVVVAEASHGHWVTGAVRAIVVAVVFGSALGWVTGTLAERGRRAGRTTAATDTLVVLGTALLSYEAALAMDANGFVSAFVAGAVFATASGGTEREPMEFTEDVGLFLSFAVWVIFGALLAGPVLRAGVHLRPVVYAVVSLTVIRMVPVALALVGTKLRRDTVGFVGWFGPRGLASVVFTLLVLEELHGSLEARQLTEVATWTILLSVFAHGLSAGPLARRYGARLSRAPADTPELEAAPEASTRRRALEDRRPRPDGAPTRRPTTDDG
jgi:NhaP-type Na+/H+ or K+/H+ antiporter